MFQQRFLAISRESLEDFLNQLYVLLTKEWMHIDNKGNYSFGQYQYFTFHLARSLVEVSPMCVSRSSEMN